MYICFLYRLIFVGSEESLLLLLLCPQKSLKNLVIIEFPQGVARVFDLVQLGTWNVVLEMTKWPDNKKKQKKMVL